jgi:hypothetical protein
VTFSYLLLFWVLASVLLLLFIGFLISDRLFPSPRNLQDVSSVKRWKQVIVPSSNLLQASHVPCISRSPLSVDDSSFDLGDAIVNTH